MEEQMRNLVRAWHEIEELEKRVARLERLVGTTDTSVGSTTESEEDEG